MKGKPVLLFVDNEGASLGEDSKFQLHLEYHKMILKRKQGNQFTRTYRCVHGHVGEDGFEDAN